MSWSLRKAFYFKVVILLLLTFALFSFAYKRREIFFQQAQKLIEQNLEKNFSCELAIGKITPRFFYGRVKKKESGLMIVPVLMKLFLKKEKASSKGLLEKNIKMQ